MHNARPRLVNIPAIVKCFAPTIQGTPIVPPTLYCGKLFAKNKEHYHLHNELTFLRVLSRVMAGREDTAALGRYPSEGACAATGRAPPRLSPLRECRSRGHLLKEVRAPRSAK